MSVADKAGPSEGRAAATNRKAFHQYEILEKFEVGIVLFGTEVKALREGRVNLGDAFVKVDREEAWLWQMHIGPFMAASRDNHEPLRKRKLLLHKREILRIMGLVRQKGLTVVPIRIYSNRDGRYKIEVALVRGKTQGDKREAIREREAKREIQRVFRSRQKVGR
ncbi:MAG: SsrA-binding protein SmpB [Leptospirales bacterium]